MQLFVLALVIGIFAHDALGEAPDASAVVSGWRLLAWALLPKLSVALLFAVQCNITRRRLGARRGYRALQWLHRSSNVYRYAALFLFANDLRTGLLVATRSFIGGDWVLVDELIVIAPTMALIFFGWWAYYPIDRAMREASLIRQIDAGLPIHRIWTRGEYLMSQWRHQIALMFVPLMIMVAWIEAVSLITTRYGEAGLLRNVAATQTIMILAGTACVFLFAPVMIRWMWDTVPLPAGELRDRLMRMCHLHRVGVRELLLWRTFGGMINAAVMGLVAPLRFILLSDGLLEMMGAKQVEAVMAHEIAHVRKGHMFWLVAAAVALMIGLGDLWNRAMQVVVDYYVLSETADVPIVGPYLADARYQEMAAAVGALGCWIFAFGWVSRRFERQADTFAVQHLARTADPTPSHEDAMANDTAILTDDGGGLAVAAPPATTRRTAPTHIDHNAVAIMARALGQVASLNQISVDKRSWRHGSIRWRQDYLATLVGRPIDQVPIDRQVATIKIASAAALVAIGLAAWQGSM